MTDDIVTRLREEFCNHGLWENACLPDDKCPCCLAADEIERLRKENAIANANADHYKKWMDNYSLAFERAQAQIKQMKEQADYEWELEHGGFE